MFSNRFIFYFFFILIVFFNLSCLFFLFVLMSSYLDEILGCINEHRIALDLKELTSLDLENINSSFSNEIKIFINEEKLQNGNSSIECVIEELLQILQANDLNTKKLLARFLSLPSFLFFETFFLFFDFLTVSFCLFKCCYSCCS